MEHLIQEATQLRVPLRLQVINGNDRALSFYKRYGFQHVGKTETHLQVERPFSPRSYPASKSYNM